MNNISRRRMLRQSLVLCSEAAAVAALVGQSVRAEQPTEKPAEPRTIEVVAQRFKFTPDEIHLKRGERVVLAIKSLDFVHGMNIPDFGMRADLMPGQITKVELQPNRSGTFDFLCDNFCGDGHEGMHGHFIVSD